jgi:hypothetical protein
MRSEPSFLAALAAALVMSAAGPAVAAPVAGEAAAASPAPWHAADAIVATIGYQVIPRSLVEAYRAAFEPAQPVPVALQRLIDDRLLAAEARRYALAPKAGELEAARKAHPLPPGFAASEWDQILLDRILAQRFVDFRFGDFVPVSREEIRAFIQRNPAGFKGTAEANEAKARALLLPVARSKREEAFKAEVRERVHVRLVREALPPD